MMKLTKKRKKEIKQALLNYKANKELASVYDELISRYKLLKKEQGGILYEEQKSELLECNRVRLNLYRKVETIDKCIACLDNVDQCIVIRYYFDKWSITKISQELHYSEQRIFSRLVYARSILDKFII